MRIEDNAVAINASISSPSINSSDPRPAASRRALTGSGTSSGCEKKSPSHQCGHLFFILYRKAEMCLVITKTPLSPYTAWIPTDSSCLSNAMKMSLTIAAIPINVVPNVAAFFVGEISSRRSGYVGNSIGIGSNILGPAIFAAWQVYEEMTKFVY